MSGSSAEQMKESVIERQEESSKRRSAAESSRDEDRREQMRHARTAESRQKHTAKGQHQSAQQIIEAEARTRECMPVSGRSAGG
jgi:hypothetical protein